MRAIPAVLGALLVVACAQRDHRALAHASEDAAAAVRRGDAGELARHVLVGARGRVDYAAILGDRAARQRWARSLKKPKEIRPHATVFLAPDQPVEVRWSARGWVFAEDP